VKDRFWKKFEAATKASDRLELDRLEDFRKTLLSFTRTYDFLSQIYNYEDTALEKKAIFYRLLSREIRDNSPRETIDLDGVELAKLGFRKSDTVKLHLGSEEGALKPLTAAGTGVAHDPVLTTIKEAIEQMNNLFDDEGLTNGDFEGFITYVAAKAREVSKIQDQAKANTLERFLESPDLRPILLAALFAATGNFHTMGKELAEDDQKLSKLIEIVGKVLHKQLSTES
jgi:type I restriction enzyme R subunit